MISNARLLNDLKLAHSLHRQRFRTTILCRSGECPRRTRLGRMEEEEDAGLAPTPTTRVYSLSPTPARPQTGARNGALVGTSGVSATSPLATEQPTFGMSHRSLERPPSCRHCTAVWLLDGLPEGWTQLGEQVRPFHDHESHLSVIHEEVRA